MNKLLFSAGPYDEFTDTFIFVYKLLVLQNLNLNCVLNWYIDCYICS